MNPLLAQFLAEANDLLTRMHEGLLQLERVPGDPPPVDEVFRAVHTLKGSSGLFDLPALTRLTQGAEDLLDAGCGGRLALDAGMVDDLRAAFDLIRGWLAHVATYERLPAGAGTDASGLITRLRAPVAAGAPAAIPAGAATRVGTRIREADREKAARAGVERLGGSVTMRSERGPGTSTRPRSPLSVAVTPVMLVSVAGQRFGVPVDVVVEAVRVPTGEMGRVPRQDVVMTRGEVIPVIDLAWLLDMPRSPDAEQDRQILVVSVDGRRIGLLVERFHRALDVLLEPMEGLLRYADEFSGTALLGDGSVLLVLNPRKVLGPVARHAPGGSSGLP